MNNPHADTRLRYEQNLYQNILFFAHELWIDRELHRKSPLSEIEEDIICYAAFGPKKRGILAPRKLGKTTFVVALLTCWRLYRDPQRQILIPSKSHEHAKKIVRLIKGWLKTVPFLTHLYPRKNIEMDTATAFNVQGSLAAEKQASVTAIGIDGQLEGNRAHSVFPDDCETEGNTQTIEARDELDERVKEFFDILYDEMPLVDGKPNPQIIPSIDPCEVCYVGTYHHEDSLYIRLSRRGYAFQTWPIAYPTPNETVLNLAPFLARRLEDGTAKGGDPVYPHRFGPKEIDAKRQEGFLRFAMQHMLLCDLADKRRYPLKLADLIVLEVARNEAPIAVTWGVQNADGSTTDESITVDAIDPTDRLYRPIFIDKIYAPYTGTKAYIDPAGRGTDLTGYASVAMLHGVLWCKACLGFKGGADTASLDTIAEQCRANDARDVYYESNIDFAGTYGQLLGAALQRAFIKPGGTDPAGVFYPTGWTASLTPVHSGSHMGHKELRVIAALEPIMSSHRLVMDPESLRHKRAEEPGHSLQYQLTRITKDRHSLAEDGKIDALAGCVAQWTASLAISPEQAAARHEQNRMDEYLTNAAKRIRSSTVFAPAPQPSWIQHDHFARQ